MKEPCQVTDQWDKERTHGDSFWDQEDHEGAMISHKQELYVVQWVGGGMDGYVGYVKHRPAQGNTDQIVIGKGCFVGEIEELTEEKEAELLYAQIQKRSAEHETWVSTAEHKLAELRGEK